MNQPVPTNVKNLPEGRYFTMVLHTDRTVWFVSSQPSRYRVILQQVRVLPDPEWKPEIIPGGFAGHCTNQHKQTWLFSSIDAATETEARYSPRTDRWEWRGSRFLPDTAIHFYDYNF